MAAANTVLNAMVLCGVNSLIQWNGSTAAERIATEVFDDDFQSCIDLTYDELEENLKMYSALTVANGQIRLRPHEKRNIKAFIQWCKDRIRVDDDPSIQVFPVIDAADLIRRYKTHLNFISKKDSMSENIKPIRFTEKIKWDEWKPTFINFLRTLPGRHGVPLNYICRDNDAAVFDPFADMLDDYVNRAPLAGEAFETDAAEVHSYIVKFINGNPVAEVKLLPFQDDKNGRLDFQALKDHYEGVGINAIDILKADKIIKNLYYMGEKKPHMWWDEFEKQLTFAFTTYDKKEQRNVYSEEMRLRTLCEKVNADFLQMTKSTVMLELSRVPINMTYNQALSIFCNVVNSKFPPELSQTTNRSRRVNESRSDRNSMETKRSQIATKRRNASQNLVQESFNVLMVPQWRCTHLIHLAQPIGIRFQMMKRRN